MLLSRISPALARFAGRGLGRGLGAGEGVVFLGPVSESSDAAVGSLMI